MGELRDYYTKKAVAQMAVGLDWEVMGMVFQYPSEYRFKKNGQPDKRYSNYSEAVAFLQAEDELRDSMINEAVKMIK